MNPAHKPPLLNLRDVSVRFGPVQALYRASLDVHRGDFIALVGANGSGKTTLLRALHGMLAHEGRRVLADDLAERNALQAMVYQRPFMLRLSVANNLRVALWLAGVARALWPQRLATALRRVGLAELA
ncbi:MAG: ATP-binding cassette domain-containing protein, partial [Burkholderiaceae bacterium]